MTLHSLDLALADPFTCLCAWASGANSGLCTVYAVATEQPWYVTAGFLAAMIVGPILTAAGKSWFETHSRDKALQAAHDAAMAELLELRAKIDAAGGLR